MILTTLKVTTVIFCICYSRSTIVELNDKYQIQGESDAPYTGKVLEYLKHEKVRDDLFSQFPVDPEEEFASIISYKGIPFAEPPNRFEKPIKFRNSNNFYDASLYKADKFAKKCPQTTIIADESEELPISEDCLYLNIFAPDINETKVPVYVWIHGGGYDTGGSSSVDTRFLVAAHKVIVVTLTYRLNIFGFFKDNVGLYDQRMALEWVKDEIKNFGGDPNDVTIFGQSAGGGSVHQQLVYDALRLNGLYGSSLFKIKDSERLFNRVIMQSGTNQNFWASQPLSRQQVILEKIHHELCLIDLEYAEEKSEANEESVERKLKSMTMFDLLQLKNRIFESSIANTPFTALTPIQTDFIPSFSELYEEVKNCEDNFREEELDDLFKTAPYLNANYSGYDVIITTQELEMGASQSYLYVNQYYGGQPFASEDTLHRYISQNVYIDAQNNEFTERFCYLQGLKDENFALGSCLEDIKLRRHQETVSDYSEDFLLTEIAPNWRSEYTQELYSLYETDELLSFNYSKTSAGIRDWQQAAYFSDFAFITDSVTAFQSIKSRNPRSLKYFQNKHYQVLFENSNLKPINPFYPFVQDAIKFKSAGHGDDLSLLFGTYFCVNNPNSTDVYNWQNQKYCNDNRELRSDGDVNAAFILTQSLMGKYPEKESSDGITAVIIQDGGYLDFEDNFYENVINFEFDVVDKFSENYPYIQFSTGLRLFVPFSLILTFLCK